MPLLAELGRGGGRLVTLGSRTGASREALRQTLGSLIADGLVLRNPGYGHPLRPEYVLTEPGRLVAPAAARVLETLQAAGLESVGLKKWTLPVLARLAPERRFSELRHELRLSPRALTLALKDLEAAGLAERLVTTGRPPATIYRPTASAAEIAAAVHTLTAATAGHAHPV